MPDKCPRCGRKMDNIAMWWPVNIGEDEPIHVCKDCAKEAEYIDEAYADACARAKRKWYLTPSIEIDTLLPNTP